MSYRRLGLAVIECAMADLALNCGPDHLSDKQRKLNTKLRRTARQFFFTSCGQAGVEFWSELAEVSPKAIIEAARRRDLQAIG